MAFLARFWATVVALKYKVNLLSYLPSGGDDGCRIALKKFEANISIKRRRYGQKKAAKSNNGLLVGPYTIHVILSADGRGRQSESKLLSIFGQHFYAAGCV